MIVFTVSDIIYFGLAILLVTLGGSLWLICNMIEVTDRIKKKRNKEKEQ